MPLPERLPALARVKRTEELLMKAKCKANKLLAMLLSLVMLVGLLSTTALAADKIAVTEVNFTLSGYELGKKVVDAEPTISTTGVTWKTDYEFRYLVAKSDDTGSIKAITDSTATFAASTQYWLVVVFKAENGYDISTLTQEKIKLNGVPASDITIFDGSEGIAAFFKLDPLTDSTHSTPTVVDTVDFKLSGYELGEKIVDVKPTISTSGVTWGDEKQYDGAYFVAKGDDFSTRENISDDTATFAADTQYWLGVRFKADDGYDISALTQEEIKLNGVPAYKITQYSFDGSIAAFFKLNKLTGSTPSTPTAVDAVDFTLSGYELGKKVVEVELATSTNGVTWDGENKYDGAYAVWQGEYENTPSLIPADSTAAFAADTQYWLSVSLKAVDGYDISALTIDNIKLNGVAAAGFDANMIDGSMQATFKLNKLTESTPTEYTISFDVNGGNGTIASQTTSGHKLTSLPTAARSGSYSFVGWFTAASGGTEITPSYEFTADTTVFAHWTYTGSSGTGGGTTPKPTQPETPKLPFTDVSEDDWFYADAAYLYEKGVMKGTADETFAPGRSVTRGQLAAALYRMAGEPAVTAKAAFTDVPADYWCAAAITWAAENGVVTGYGDGGFRPADAVQRQELAAMLFRFAVYQGMSAVTLQESLAPFADKDAVAAYAVPAMNWAVGQGILQSKDGSLLPQAPVDRAQLAAMLRRYLEK